MSLVINTNVSSIAVQRNLSLSTSSVNTAIERLSTGFKINNASDDAAGLVISQGLESQARGSEVAQANAQTGVNLLQTAEGDLGIVQENLQRIRDLSIQAANGTFGSVERRAVLAEVTARFEEVNRLVKASKFNNVNLLDGTGNDLTLQIGSNSGATLNSLSIGSPLGLATTTGLGITSATQDLTTVLGNAFTNAISAASFIGTIDLAIDSVSTRRSQIGSLQNRLESVIKSLSIKVENMKSANSRIRDTDIAKEAAQLTKSQILQQASISLIAQANQAPSIALSLI